ncbi:MAG TPA: sulfatase [Planctomycetota bacterium]|nr:sulfatase [Planctomycetota bacterium]
MTMKRRDFLKATGLGVALLPAGQQLARAGEAPTAARPNVVLIISDDQGFGDHGFMGHDAIQTPRLDRLASGSVVFTRGYVTAPLCGPSLATLLTGLYPHQHRITGNDPGGRGPRAPFFEAFEKCPRLPEILGRAGYASFQSGKFWMAHYSRAGFTDGMTVKGRHGEAGLSIGRQTMKPVLDFVDKAKADGKPFFLWYAPMMPHLPHNPPPRLLDKYKAKTDNLPLAKYWAMCEWFDESCGQLLDHLDQQGLRENTLVVYVCDNGWVQPDPKRPGHGAGRGKLTPYDGGLRTPIMLRWPGRLAPRMDREHLASSLDLVPTILAACGLKPPPEMPGLSLLDEKAVGARDAVFAEYYTHDMADVAAPAKSLRARVCIQGDWKLILWQGLQPKVGRPAAAPPAKAELYHLKDDPFEKANLAEKHPDKVAALTKRLDEWWRP